LQNSLIIAVFAFITQTAFNFMENLFPVFTIQYLGWTDQVYANFYATSSLIGGNGGMVIGGYLIDRFGKVRMLNSYLFLLFFYL
jgi:PAT family beta-lactamase induction signal transducer AmpG